MLLVCIEKKRTENLANAARAHDILFLLMLLLLLFSKSYLKISIKSYALVDSGALLARYSLKMMRLYLMHCKKEHICRLHSYAISQRNDWQKKKPCLFTNVALQTRMCSVFSVNRNTFHMVVFVMIGCESFFSSSIIWNVSFVYSSSSKCAWNFSSLTLSQVDKPCVEYHTLSKLSSCDSFILTLNQDFTIFITRLCWCEGVEVAIERQSCHLVTV